jgi:alpha-1,6-mannosyltransferase
MKTPHLTNAWHSTSGGIGTFYRSLLDRANQTGHSLRLVVPSDRDRVKEAGAFGRIYHVNSARAPLYFGYRMLYPYHYLSRRGRICEILNAERPDLIEICDKYTLPYLGGLLRVHKLKCVDLKAPIIGLSCERMDENMLAYFGGSALGKRFCRWYMKNIYFPQFDSHIANSEHTAGELRDASRGHKVKRGVWVMPMGVDTASFSPELRSASLRSDLARRCGGTEQSVLLLYAGRLAPEKNLPLLAEVLGVLAARYERDFRLLVAGQGMLRESFERLCHSAAQGRVCFLGHLATKGELARLYASADVFVHPNPREPFGIAPLEAMASGLALVAPNSGGVTSYADAGNAWLADADPHSFAAAIEAAAAPGPDRDAKIARAFATSQDYEWGSIAGEFLEFYREAVACFRGERGETARPARFYSTPGDYWGREVPETGPAIPQGAG